MFKQIKDVPTRTVAADGDLLIMQDYITGETYNIAKDDLLAGFSGGGGGATIASVNIPYSNDGNFNGVLNYIGTSGNTQPWVNPVNKGVILSASSIGSGSLDSLADRQAGQFYTGNNPGDWVQINLGSSKLKCSYYSIRNRNAELYFLRSWKFQGSNNGNDWSDLDTQVDNTSLNTPSQWLSLPVITNTEYTRFRLMITGPTSSGHYFICLGELEIYGLYTP